MKKDQQTLLLAALGLVGAYFTYQHYKASQPLVPAILDNSTSMTASGASASYPMAGGLGSAPIYEESMGMNHCWQAMN